MADTLAGARLFQDREAIDSVQLSAATLAPSIHELSGPLGISA